MSFFQLQSAFNVEWQGQCEWIIRKDFEGIELCLFLVFILERKEENIS
jgi:hypothetical protein